MSKSRDGFSKTQPDDQSISTGTMQSGTTYAGKKIQQNARGGLKSAESSGSKVFKKSSSKPESISNSQNNHSKFTQHPSNFCDTRSTGRSKPQPIPQNKFKPGSNSRPYSGNRSYNYYNSNQEYANSLSPNFRQKPSTSSQRKQELTPPYRESNYRHSPRDKSADQNHATGSLTKKHSLQGELINSKQFPSDQQAERKNTIKPPVKIQHAAGTSQNTAKLNKKAFENRGKAISNTRSKPEVSSANTSSGTSAVEFTAPPKSYSAAGGQRKRNRKRSTNEQAQEATSKPDKSGHPMYQEKNGSDAGNSVLEMVNKNSKQSEKDSGATKKDANENAVHSKQDTPAFKEQHSENRTKINQSNEELVGNSSQSTKKQNEELKKGVSSTPPKSLPLSSTCTSSLTQSVSSNCTKMEKLGLEQAKERLEKDFISFLEKRSPSFPHAKFLCQLCNYHLDNVPLAHRHIKEKRHRKLMKERQQDDLLRKLLPPPHHAVDSLEQLLTEDVLQPSVLDEEDIKLRKSVVRKLDDIIGKEMPKCHVIMYGSSLSGLGFKTSDINVDLQHSADMKSPSALLRVLDILERSDAYRDVTSDFRAKVPRIDFVDAETNSPIRLSTGNEFAIFTSRLLLFYSLLDSRVQKLSMVFRTWAQMCKLDLQHEGSLPPHTIPIMTIFFMQIHRYLPVLHEVISEKDMHTILTSSLTCSELVTKRGQLWYVPSTPAESSVDNTEETLKLKESESETDLGTALSLTQGGSDSDSDNSVVFSSNTDKKCENNPVSLEPVGLCGDCIGSNMNIAELWLQLIKFYALEYPLEEEIITLQTSTRLKREDKNWSKRRIAVIDPYSSKRNLCRSMCSQAVFAYMMSRLKSAVIYFFNVPCPVEMNSEDLKGGNNSPSAISGSEGRFVKKQDSTTTSSPRKNDFADDETLNNEDYFVIDTKLHSTANFISQTATEDALQDICSTLNRVSVSDSSKSDERRSSNKNLSLKDKAGSGNKTESTISGTNGRMYKFSKDVITDGKYPVTVCGLCKKEGHAKKNCPEETETHTLSPLPPLTTFHISTLDKICRQLYDHYVPTPEEIYERDEACNSISRYLQSCYNKSTTMNLFGSSRNGFGFRGSDLDICMTFKGNETGEDLDFVKIIEEVAKQLRRNPHLRSILPITTAKVPIVKFEHCYTRLEGDISLYNLLAQRNTSMLSLYSSIDRRCKVLGYAMKAFVKLCNIGDASRGSLSSYAYTLMVIFFLQQRNPPVLPVLQELQKSEESVHMVDGWNSWFYDDLKSLPNTWEGYNKNKESVGELWIGLLRYYTETFDFKKHVIAIRQEKPLTTFEKEWTSKHISIEDPFDLNHNLGAGVSHKMTHFIIRVFIKAREHFGTMPNCKLFDNEAVHYFFDPLVLMDGEEVPNDRCCRICGKIGHFVRDCPRNKKSRKKHDGADAGVDNNASQYRCFVCGELGHIKRHCPELKMQEKNRYSKSRSNYTSPVKTSPQKSVNSSQKQTSSNKQRENNKKNQLSSSPNNQLPPTSEIQPPITPRSSTQPESQNSTSSPAVSTQAGSLTANSVTSTEEGGLPLTQHSKLPDKWAGTSASSTSSQINRPSIVQSYPMSPTGNHPPSSQAVRLTNSGMFLPQPLHAPSPMMTVAQIESQMLQNSPQRPHATSYPNEHGMSHPANFYQGQPNFTSRSASNPPVSPVSMVTGVPVHGVRVMVPGSPFTRLTPPGMLQTPGSPISMTPPSPRDMTSQFHHPPPPTYCSSLSNSWNLQHPPQ